APDPDSVARDKAGPGTARPRENPHWPRAAAPSDDQSRASACRRRRDDRRSWEYCQPSLRRSPLNHLIRYHHELLQLHPPEARGQRDIGGIAAGGHQDAADARHVVTGIEGVPFAGEPGLVPAGEIHRGRLGRNADVAHIAGAVARGDAHAATEGDREMGEVAANAALLLVDVMRRFHVMRMLIPERD